MKASPMTKVLGHLQSNVIAYVALFVALGGTGYAAISLPAGSVGNRQLKNHSVTPIKFDPGSIAGYVRAYAQISTQGQITAARPGAHVVVWRTSFSPGGLIEWSEPMPASCFALATTPLQDDAASSVSAQFASGGPKHDASTYLLTSVAGRAVNVAVFCPQP